MPAQPEPIEPVEQTKVPDGGQAGRPWVMNDGGRVVIKHIKTGKFIVTPVVSAKEWLKSGAGEYTDLHPAQVDASTGELVNAIDVG